MSSEDPLDRFVAPHPMSPRCTALLYDLARALVEDHDLGDGAVAAAQVSHVENGIRGFLDVQLNGGAVMIVDPEDFGLR